MELAPIPPTIPFQASAPIASFFLPNVDEATVSLLLTPSAVEIREIVDANTALVRLTPSALEGLEYVDAGTLYLDLQAETCEIFVPRHQWFAVFGYEAWELFGDTRFTPVGEERWEVGLVEIGDIAECQ